MTRGQSESSVTYMTQVDQPSDSWNTPQTPDSFWKVVLVRISTFYEEVEETE